MAASGRPVSAVQGGESGVPAIVPGNPDASELLKRIASRDPESDHAAAVQIKTSFGG
ncbi:MAG UNVERIFIED_CONTAM: hypothetical protein LVR18_43125 [Planctomycetaceae bacterium]